MWVLLPCLRAAPVLLSVSMLMFVFVCPRSPPFVRAQIPQGSIEMKCEATGFGGVTPNKVHLDTPSATASAVAAAAAAAVAAPVRDWQCWY